MSVFRKGDIELRLGDWREVLRDVEPDAVITDPPYSKRTQEGQRSCGRLLDQPQPKRGAPRGGSIDYGHVSPEWWSEWSASWLPRVRRWCVAFGDHLSAQWALDAWAADDWYTFAPVIWTKTDAAPRFMCDGPSAQHETIAIARPRRVLDRAEKHFRPGWYSGGCRSGKSFITGGKPPWLMRALIRDYSRPGDLVCDPCAGGATTLIAAAMEGRRAIGSEIDPDTFEKACKRIDRLAISRPLPGLDLERAEHKQMKMEAF